VGVAVAVTLGVALGVVLGVSASRWFARRGAARDVRATVEDQVPESEPNPNPEPDMAGVLREAVEHLETGVLVADAEGEVNYRNAAARSFEGTHVGVLIDDHVAEVIAAAQAATATSMTVELQGPPKTWLEISADAVRNGGAIVTIRDVSEQMRTDVMRSDFVSNVSHELKTPVGAVAVLAEALIDEPDLVVVRRLSHHLVEEAHRAVRTIDELLQLSQIEATQLGDDVVDVHSVVQRAIGRGRAVDAGRGVEITVLDECGPLRMRGDERQLVSAVGNLVENAVKYSHPGDVVAIRTRIEADALEVTVTDQGIGIPRRDLDRVFERFYRIDRARSRETGGTGLGLAIVRHVVTNHGGDVFVSSREGEGSTFVMRFPASLLVGAPTPEAAHPQPRQLNDEAS
jgi:two-component system sensor histidine kinase SenX3